VEIVLTNSRKIHYYLYFSNVEEDNENVVIDIDFLVTYHLMMTRVVETCSGYNNAFAVLYPLRVKYSFTDLVITKHKRTWNLEMKCILQNSNTLQTLD
jgi:hypothetical protein